VQRAFLLLVMAAAGAGARAQPLSPQELEALSRLERLSQEEAHAAAAAQFEGQAARIAHHYLRHTGTPPGPNAYFFALEAVGDADAAAVLAGALVEAPEPESGPEFTSGGRRQRLRRHDGEIAVALESALARETVARDARVAQALTDAIVALRAQPNGLGRGPAARAVELLGRCDSDPARDALRRLAADSDGDTRAHALAALGSAGRADDAGLLALTLRADPQPAARGRAAAAVARLGARDAIPALAAALDAESHPQVVDAVVQALAALGALPDDPARCLAAAARCWDPAAAAPAFACWHASASPGALQEVALTGAPVVRALALAALFEAPATGREPLVQWPGRFAPPPPVIARGSMPAVGTSRPLEPPASPPRSPFDQAARERLLASAVEVLSHSPRAIPDRPRAISSAVAQRVNDLLLEIAGRDMHLALAYADRIETPSARTRNDGRFAASAALWRRDARAYVAERRPRQAILAAGIALAAAVLASFRSVGTAGIAAAVPAAVWALWTLRTDSVRELPPLALAPLTVVGSASLAAALVCAAVELWRNRRARPASAASLVIRAGSIGVAAAVGFALCGAARWLDVYPVGGEGWELVFEPLGAGLVSAVLAVASLTVAAVSGRWLPAARD
jgi:hypothetical protein